MIDPHQNTQQPTDNVADLGATLAAAISATFSRRATPLPQGAPPALSEAFSEDSAKQRLW